MKIRTALSALALAAAFGSAAGGTLYMLDGALTPHPPAAVNAPISPLATYLGVNDCPTEDSNGQICVWDADFRGNQKGQSFLVVYWETFRVDYNEDGTIYIDDNHDGEPGYPDN